MPSDDDRARAGGTDGGGTVDRDETVAGSAGLSEDETEPDYRFTLANERTFLAWIRTALALLAGGIAIEEVGSFSDSATRRALAMTAVVLSFVLAASSFVRWRQVQAAMRQGRPLPHPWALPVLATVVVAVAGIVALVLLVP